ncbi:MAG TPA: hypothetical protein VN641_21155, partial [Urbifossiella sp.]|nr:hypothetical protein [Urbifossiella sp.]
AHLSTMTLHFGKSRPPRRSAAQYDAKLRKMTAADFEVEARYCDRFCKEAIAVAELPFEKQSGQHFRLEQLQRSSFLLPAVWGVHPRIGIDITRGHAMIGAALCVAAVRRWILGNADKPPDLDTALAAAGIEVPLLDPFSEKPYQLSFHEDQIEIHWEDAEPYVAGTLTT